MAFYYLGTFPPPFGGVTIKNKNLYQALSGRLQLERIDFGKVKNKSIPELLRFLKAVSARKSRLIVGISGKRNRKYLSGLLYYWNRKAMNHSILIVMGGAAARDIVQDKAYAKYVMQYHSVYVETKGMYDMLRRKGIFNVQIYPNGRFAPKEQKIPEEQQRKGWHRLKCVFFSQIYPKKGVDVILSAAARLSDTEFAFYGPIRSSYKEDFQRAVNGLPNVTYRGVFSGSSEAVYRELRNYDVLLLPTKWEAEGIPGIVVEAKIAGIVPILTNTSFNGELIDHGKDGYLMEIDDDKRLTELIALLDQNRTLLWEMKRESRLSAEAYFIEHYIDGIVNSISE